MFKILKKKLINFVKYSNNFYNFKKKKPKKDYMDFLEGIIISIISYQKKVKIIQIGANDGVNGDPIYNIVKKYPSNIEYLGIEPDEPTFFELQKNYHGMNNVFLVNRLIGDGSVINFYNFNKNFKKFDKHMSGLNSVHKEAMERQLSRRGLENFDKYVDIKKCQSFTLKDAIQEYPQMLRADFLQIDAEGFDDEIIYNSSIKEFNFKVINFESKLLSSERFSKLKNFLEKNNFKIYKWKKSDTIAVRIDI